MKITLDKNTITLAKAEEAKQFAKDNDWIGKDELKQCAELVLRKYHNYDWNLVDEILRMPKSAEVIDQQHLGFGIYVSNLIVKYWHKEEGEERGQKIAIIGCNVTECLAGNVNGWVQVFANTDDQIV